METRATGRTLAFDETAENERLLARCRAAVDAACAAGAEEAEAYAHATLSVGVQFEKGELKLTQVDEGTSIGVRAFKDKRLGFSSTNQSDAASLAGAARDAVELAGFNPPDEHNTLPEARPITPGESLVRPELLELDVPAVVALGRELVAQSTPDPRLALDKAQMTLVRGTHAVASTTGTAAVESDANLSFHVFGMAVDGDDVGGFHYCGDCVRDRGTLETRLARVADEFSSVALGNLGAQAGESYQGPVAFSPAAFWSIFLAPLVSAASAVAVQRGRSALAGKVGERIAAAVLGIVDDPTDRDLAGVTSFDREGQPCGRFPLVEDGVLQSYLFNGYAANVGATRSTGHAAGGARGVPGIAPHSVCVAPGIGGTPDDLLRSLDRGLFVQRFSGTVDPASGDFSGVAKSARRVEGGRVICAVKETLLSGNAFELLKNDLVLSSTAETLSGSLRAPHALIDGLNVSAG